MRFSIPIQLLLFWLSAWSPAFAAVSLNYIYDSNPEQCCSPPFTALPSGADIFDSGPSGTNLNGGSLAESKVVMQAAGTMIENLFENCTDVSLSRDIYVGWDTHGGSTLAMGGVRSFTSGTTTTSWGFITWDNNDSSFFVDPTPMDNSEYSATPTTSTTRSIVTIPGSSPPTSINAENRFYAQGVGNTADGNSDMLSTAIHELMHALGVSSLSALDNGLDGDLDLTAFGSTHEVSYNNSHTSEVLPWGGPMGTSASPYYPNVIGPSTINSTRGLLADLDALLLANVLGISDYSCVAQPFGTVQAVPEPSSFAFLALTLLCIRCKKNVFGLVARYLPRN